MRAKRKMTKLTTAEKRIVVAIVLKKCVLKRVDISTEQISIKLIGICYNSNMNKIIPHVLNADSYLDDFLPAIEKAIARAKQIAYKELDITWPIDLVITSGIPEINGAEGVGGRTCNESVIIINIDTICNPSSTLIYQIICHELCHAAKEGFNPNDDCEILFDDLIHEGFAIYYEKHLSTKQKSVRDSVKIITNVSETQAHKLLKKMPPLSQHWGEYDASSILGDGIKAGYGHWAGYKIGYFLVCQYLQKTRTSFISALHDGNIKYRQKLSEYIK